MELDLLYDLLNLDPQEPPREVIDAARLRHRALPYVALSILEREAKGFGPASRADLERARIREAQLAVLADEITARFPVRVMKGPEIARWYPEGVLRGYADLDLLAPDEETVWQVVGRLMDREPVDRVNIGVIGGAPRHLVVSLAWASTDPIVDPGYGADVTTAALAGNFRSVPVRAGLPPNPAAAALLAVAEERFQRPFSPRDVLDVLVIDAAPLPPVGDLVQLIIDYHLPPEVAELVAETARHRTLGTLAALLEPLADHVTEERSRRAAAPAPTAPAGSSGPGPGQIAHCYPVGPIAWRGGDRATVEPFSHGRLLRTPVGDYLLAEGGTVQQAHYEAAVAHCKQLPAVR